jgi:hypothetical protein
MLRPFSAVVLVIALVTCLSVAQQQTTPQSPHAFPVPTKISPSDPNQLQLVVDLLKESHDLLADLPLQTRLNLLISEAQTMSSTRPHLAREWAEELFALSLKAEDHERLSSQEHAVILMAGIDPERGRELLHSMPPLKMDSEEEQPKMLAAWTLFGGLAARDGIAVVPLLDQEAELLAREGHYPYTAMMKGAVEAGFQQRRQARFARVENEQALKDYRQFVQQQFDKIAARYYGSTPTFADDVEFGHAIQTAAHWVSQESVRSALRVTVKNFLSTTAPKTLTGKLTLTTRDGRSFTADNSLDKALLPLTLFISGIDPELSAQLQSTRPQLKAASQMTKDAQHGSDITGTIMIPDSNRNTLREAPLLANQNPDLAIAKLQQLPEGQDRTIAMLSVATTIAENDPQRADKLITDTPGYANDDYINSQRMLSRATVATKQRKLDEFQRLFKEISDMYRLRDPRKTPAGLYLTALEGFVRLGAKDATDFTIDLVQKVPETEVKARLLWAAASAIRSKSPIMGGFPNVQKPAPAL